MIEETSRPGLLEFAVIHPRAAVAMAFSTDGAPQLDVPVFTARGGFLSEVTDVEQSQGLLGVARIPPSQDLDTLTAGGGRKVFLLLDAVQDPGNVGALIRSAWALGADGVIIGPGTADPFGPKAIRASAGGVFRLPCHLGFTIDEAAILTAGDFRFYIARSDGRPFGKAVYHRRTVLAVGNEARGFSKWISDIGEAVSVPMAGDADSLNVVVAGSIILEAMINRKTVP